MDWLFIAAGVLLILAGIADVFFTVLHPDGFGFLSIPKDHPARQAPYLPALIMGLDMAISFLDERFLSEDLEKAPAPVPFETFRSALERDEEPEDPWVARFSEMQLYMRNLAGIEEPPPAGESYDRYKEWLPFAHRNWAFFEASARDLVYELEDLNYGPGERLF